MSTAKGPYPLPRKLEPGLARVLAYWRRLERGDAAMPFADDINLSALPKLAGRLMLIDVVGKPVRFRCAFAVVGKEIGQRYGGDLGGKFLDEIGTGAPLQFLLSQASATVESRAPTYYRQSAVKGRGVRAEPGYARVLLPAWGDGSIGTLLAAFAWK